MKFSFFSFIYIVFVIHFKRTDAFDNRIFSNTRIIKIHGKQNVSKCVNTNLLGDIQDKKKHFWKNNLNFHSNTILINNTLSNQVKRNTIMGKKKLDEAMDLRSQKIASLHKERQIDIIEIKDSSSEENSLFDKKSSNHAFDLLTWNLDGLDDRFLRMRIDYICDIIKSIQPDIIFLQEIIELSRERLHKNLARQYHFILPSWKNNQIAPYYCLILVSKATCSIFSDYTQTDWFENSVMYRYLLSTLISLNSFPQDTIELMTTHLESTWQFSNQRIFQFKKAIKKLCKFDSINNNKARLVTKIFGGDLNLVDSEVKKANLPEQIKDCWEYLGSPIECKYTWDLKFNDNIKRASKNNVRRRFDRIFTSSLNKEIAADSPNNEIIHIYMPYKMKLLGTSHIEACDMFPSDHFGVYTRFERVKAN